MRASRTLGKHKFAELGPVRENRRVRQVWLCGREYVLGGHCESMAKCEVGDGESNCGGEVEAEVEVQMGERYR